MTDTQPHQPEPPDEHDATATPVTPRDMATVVGATLTRVRDGADLTPDQWRFLAHRLLYASDVECCRSLTPPLHERDAGVWKLRSPAFAAAYARLMSDGITEMAAARFGLLLGAATLTTETMLSATKPVSLETDDTDERGKPVYRTVETADWQARGKGVEMVLRPLGLFNPKERGGSGDPAALAAISALADLAREAGQRRSSAATATTIVEGTATVISDSSASVGGL